MAIRFDVTIDWSVYPRLITVSAPSTEITMQDALDTLRYMESQPSAMDNQPIVDSSGKEPLDSVTKNGLTIALLDARLGFEARLDWTQCKFSGGNLVAFDGDQVKLRKVTATTPINPTPFVNIDRASSSSGTLQEQDALQYSSYQNGVWVDVLSEYDGVAFPSGSREYPVNNVPDAVAIAQLKGFDTLNVLGTLTLGVGDDVSNLTIQGTNPMTSVLVVDPEAETTNVYIRDLYFTGTLDGGTILRDCVLGAIQYFDGFIEHCALTSTTYYINGIGILLNCVAGATCVTDPIIDMTNAQGLGVRGFSGSLVLTNKSGTGSCEVDINGRLILDASIVAGEFEVYGDGYVVDNSTGTSVLQDRTTGSPQEIAQEVVDKSFALYQNKAVFLDPERVVNGDGSALSPFNNPNDTKDFAETHGILTVYIYSDTTVPSQVKNFTVYGIGTPTIDMNGQDFTNSEFIGCKMTGAYTGNVKFEKCDFDTNFVINAESVNRGFIDAKAVWDYQLT